MRIALMTNNYKPFIGGVPISVERLAKGLEALGHEVTVFAPTYQQQKEEDNCFRYDSLMQKFMGGIVLPNPCDYKIEQEFKKKHFDIIHVHHPMLIGRTAVYLSKKYQIPLTFTYHTRYEQYLCYIKGMRMLEKGACKNNGKISRMERKALYNIQEKLVPAYLNSFLKHCSYVFAPTAGMKEYLQDACGYNEERIGILPTGIEDHHFQVTNQEASAIRTQYGAEGIPLFLSVSRMAHEKNVPFLLQSIASLKNQWKKPFKVLMVGDGPNKEEYIQKCRELGIEKEVVFTGKIPNTEIAPYFTAADAFIFASKTETQGIVILEAFAGKTPVIALEATGVSDLVEDGKNGFLCQENQEAYTRKLIAFLENKSLSEQLAEGALLKAETYRQEAVAQKAAGLYNSIIAEYQQQKARTEKRTKSAWLLEYYAK